MSVFTSAISFEEVCKDLGWHIAIEVEIFLFGRTIYELSNLCFQIKMSSHASGYSNSNPTLPTHLGKIKLYWWFMDLNDNMTSTSMKFLLL